MAPEAPPYCGYWACNIFGCNYNGSCSQYNIQGCQTQASEAFTACSFRLVPGPLLFAEPSGNTVQCTQAYNTAMANCAPFGASSKPKDKRHSTLATCDANDTSKSNSIFEFTDTDHNEYLELQEFLALVNFTKYGLLALGSDLIAYVKHFLEHDLDGDGKVSSEESMGNSS